MSASAELLSLLAMPLHCIPDKQSYTVVAVAVFVLVHHVLWQVS